MRERGTVRLWIVTRAFGFIRRDADGADVFVHARQVRDSGLSEIYEGERVEYDLIETSPNKFAAQHITLLEAAP